MGCVGRGLAGLCVWVGWFVGLGRISALGSVGFRVGVGAVARWDRFSDRFGAAAAVLRCCHAQRGSACAANWALSRSLMARTGSAKSADVRVSLCL